MRAPFRCVKYTSSQKAVKPLLCPDQIFLHFPTPCVPTIPHTLCFLPYCVSMINLICFSFLLCRYCLFYLLLCIVYVVVMLCLVSLALACMFAARCSPFLRCSPGCSVPRLWRRRGWRRRRPSRRGWRWSWPRCGRRRGLSRRCWRRGVARRG